MSDEAPTPFSFTTLIGALGGVILLLAGFLPLLSLTNPKEDKGLMWLADYRRELQEFRQKAQRPEAPPEAKQLLAVVDPSLERLDQFLADPSGYRLWFVLLDAQGFCGALLPFSEVMQLTPQDLEAIRLIRLVLRVLCFFFATIPILGGYHLVRGVLLRFRKHLAIILSLTFFASLVYLGVAVSVLVLVPPSEHAYIGPALYGLLVGGLLLLFCSLFGVSWKTWWKVYLIDLLGLVGLSYLAIRLAETISQQ